uniref:TcdA n=1 Tax=Ganoderma boninense TaxID=34458 RepID=A0A5K1JRE0_9APHY|nr:TcdA [Ganoderma boninense]
MTATTVRPRDSRYAPASPEPFSEDSYYPRRRVGRLALFTTLPAKAYKMSLAKFGRRRGPALLCFCCLAFLLSTYALHQRFLSAHKAWPVPWRGSKAAVFVRDDLRKIWDWEVQSGHYPSTRPIPVEMGFTNPPNNPALPVTANHRRPAPQNEEIVQWTTGTGAERKYADVRSRPPDFGHPPRPIPGSVADLDRIFEQCDFNAGKYVRDCHEFLRLGAGLDDAGRIRREGTEDLRYIYAIDDEGGHISARSHETTPGSNTTNIKIRAVDNWERDLRLPPYSQYTPPHEGSPCSEDDPRIFHMFWAGPFTDKPYMAMLAFLFTQNTGLNFDNPASEFSFCRPQLWLWISRGPMDAMPDPHAREDMLQELRQNAWSAPFLHPRFRDLIQFKLWNTTEQLDSTPELRNDWRQYGSRFLFSGGAPPKEPQGKKVGSDVSLDGKTKETFQTYNKMPVILSDLVRFVLCHRYGGVYLDVDMLFLRDWEELWGWSGSFSYRWSHEDRYNTAVLRLRKGSALGTFLLRTALFNNMDFHPTTVSKYLREAHLEKLLYRVPDALFDPAWLNTDNKKPYPWKTIYFQRDRPAQPFFTDFDQFFNTPPESATPSVIGFDGFFRGAFLYHYHNEWWKPFDRARFWPDLGPRFADAERMGKAAIANKSASYAEGLFKHDKRDLDWATVLKRTFEAYIRGERPNMYGEWIQW